MKKIFYFIRYGAQLLRRHFEPNFNTLYWDPKFWKYFQKLFPLHTTAKRVKDIFITLIILIERRILLSLLRETTHFFSTLYKALQSFEFLFLKNMITLFNAFSWFTQFSKALYKTQYLIFNFLLCFYLILMFLCSHFFVYANKLILLFPLFVLLTYLHLLFCFNVLELYIIC